MVDRLQWDVQKSKERMTIHPVCQMMTTMLMKMMTMMMTDKNTAHGTDTTCRMAGGNALGQRL